MASQSLYLSTKEPVPRAESSLRAADHSSRPETTTHTMREEAGTLLKGVCFVFDTSIP